MSSKTLVYLGAFVGSILGSFVPALWGASLFSYASILFSGIGGLIGIFIVLKFVNQ